MIRNYQHWMFYYTHFLTNTIIKLEIIKKKLPVKPLHFTSKRFSKSISIMQNLLKTSSRRISSQKMAFDVFETKTKAEASPLLILHGLFGSKSNWKNVAKILQKTLKPTRKVYTKSLSYPLIFNKSFSRSTLWTSGTMEKASTLRTWTRNWLPTT